jgi:hypothetical protein
VLCVEIDSLDLPHTDISQRVCCRAIFRRQSRERTEVRSHDCERCTQECVRHDLRRDLSGAPHDLVLFENE